MKVFSMRRQAIDKRVIRFDEPIDLTVGVVPAHLS